MEIFLTWLVLALLVGWFASTKGRSFFWFFVIAVITSPLIGFIIALIVKANVEFIESKAVDSGDYVKCPACAEVVKAEAKICKHCRSELA